MNKILIIAMVFLNLGVARAQSAFNDDSDVMAYMDAYT